MNNKLIIDSSKFSGLMQNSDAIVAVNLETKEEFYIDDWDNWDEMNHHPDRENVLKYSVFSKEEYLKKKEVVWLDLLISSTALEDLDKLQGELQSVIRRAYKSHHNIDIEQFLEMPSKNKNLIVTNDF